MAMNSARQSQPNWLAEQPPSNVSSPIMQATPQMREYAIWYAWARAHETELRRCHLAAEAAVGALAQGLDGSAAAQAAQAAAQNPPAGAEPTADDRTRGYAGWYAAGLHQIKLEGEPAHRFAYAALLAQERGLDQRAAAREGIASVGVPRPAQNGWLYDPAIRSIVLGGISLVALFFLPFYFVVLPVLGLIYALRMLATPRLPYAAAGLFLNGAAILYTFSRLIGLNLF